MHSASHQYLPATRSLARRRRAALVRALATLVALGIPAAARAQLDRGGAGTESGGETLVGPTEGMSFTPCAGPEGGTSGGFDVACTFNGRGRTIGGGLGSVRIAASATAGGTLHAFARAGILHDTETLYGASARAYASYWDGIVFAGYVPAFLRVTAVLHGNGTAGDWPCEHTECSQDGPGDELPTDAATGELHVIGGDWAQSITSYADSPETMTATFDYPVSLYWSETMGSMYFNFGATLFASAFARPSTLAVADYGNTAWVSGIRAISAERCDLAAAGCDVTDLVRRDGVRAASGASYGGFATHVATTTAPEPSTIALLGAGLGVLAVRARRRAR